MVRVALLPIVLLAAGCVNTARPAGPDPSEVRRVIALAASRVQACYRAPRVPHLARQIVTRLRVRYAADGAPMGLPSVIAQESVVAANRAYAAAMAEAAVSAVLRCGAMRLPPRLHSGGWDDFQLTFSPNAVA